MAIYEFACPRCSKQFELMRPMSEADKAAKCPRCGAKAEKLVSTFGSKTGFYLRTPEKKPFRKKPTKGTKAGKAPKPR